MLIWTWQYVDLYHVICICSCYSHYAQFSLVSIVTYMFTCDVTVFSYLKIPKISTTLNGKLQNPLQCPRELRVGGLQVMDGRATVTVFEPAALHLMEVECLSLMLLHFYTRSEDGCAKSHESRVSLIACGYNCCCIQYRVIRKFFTTSDGMTKTDQNPLEQWLQLLLNQLVSDT